MWCSNKTFKAMSDVSFSKRLNDTKYSFITRTKNNISYYDVNIQQLGTFIETNTITYEEPIYDELPIIYY